ncbi:MAG: 23S rRNA (guanosine(2251)-2'-O)-methyltransferase RlmB, partial [Oscillospiraceae bacterium]|nr:23S rRNA (guanosine(2251)-2'-O)-methyltransferase RlmB [Oscillospiraceae bacterium]
EILAVSAEKNTAPFIIIADEITDPHNLGALIRTAEAAGADGLVIPKRRSAGVNSTVHATSAGAASHLKICREANLADVITRLKKANIWVYGADMDGAPFHGQDFKGGTALVIGSEGAGLRRLVREQCDVIVAVDMYGKINSLNASVCGGILMYEVVRQRRAGGADA